MASAGHLALQLDYRMLKGNITVHASAGQPIAPPDTPGDALVVKNGLQVSAEVGGRYLLKYLLPWQVGTYRHGSDEPAYFTVTPLGPETPKYLAPPASQWTRTHVLLLDPKLLPPSWDVRGPRWIAMGGGLEYFLPQGFPTEALVNIGAEPGTAWELKIDD